MPKWTASELEARAAQLEPWDDEELPAAQDPLLQVPDDASRLRLARDLIWGFRKMDYEAVVRLIEAVPERGRAPIDKLVYGWGLFLVDRDDQARSELERIENSEETPLNLKAVANVRLAAIDCFEAAARDGLARIERARELASGGLPRREQARLEEVAGDLLEATSDPAGAEAAFLTSASLFAEAGDLPRAIRVRCSVATMWLVLGERDRALDCLWSDPMESWSPMQTDWWTARGVARVHALSGEPMRCLRTLDRAAAEYLVELDDYGDAAHQCLRDLAHSPRVDARPLANRVLELIADERRLWPMIYLSKLESDRANFWRASQLCESVLLDGGAPPLLEVFARANLAAHHLVAGDLDSARRYLSLINSERIDEDAELESLVRRLRAVMYRLDERLEDAEREIEAAVNAARGLADKEQLFMALGLAVDVFAGRGRLADAEASLAQAELCVDEVAGVPAHAFLAWSRSKILLERAIESDDDGLWTAWLDEVSRARDGYRSHGIESVADDLDGLLSVAQEAEVAPDALWSQLRKMSANLFEDLAQSFVSGGMVSASAAA